MFEGFVFLMIVFGAMAAVVVAAVVTKLVEVRRASRWPSAVGKVLVCTVQARKKKPNEIGYNFGDSDVTNEPLITYEYRAGKRTYRSSRITIGEKTSEHELAEILERYPVGATVTVYYDPANPNNAVLERDLPWGKLSFGAGCLVAFILGIPLLGAFFYAHGLDWVAERIANPGRAPFVTAVGGFGVLASVFGLAFFRYVHQAASWPVTQGRVVATGVEAFRSFSHKRYRISYKPSIVYEYEVKGRKFQGDRVRLGVTVSSVFPGYSERMIAKYPVGTVVDVHYDPEQPGVSVLHPRSWLHYLIWVVAAGLFGLAWLVGSGRL